MALPPPVESAGQVSVTLRPNFAPMFQCIGDLLGIRSRTTTEVVGRPEHCIRGERSQAELLIPGAAKAQETFQAHVPEPEKSALELGDQGAHSVMLNAVTR